jgi:hypothetical protein
MALLQGYSTQRAPLVESVPAADSQRVLRRVRSAQTDFEAFRRNRLPIGYRSSQPCEIHVGRYCYWRGDENDDKPAPPEQPAVRERRTALLRTLDSASSVLPGDAWIAGQVVRYLVEVDSTDAALRAARETCRATGSWCHALAGYASHSGGRFAIADSEFAIALAAMDAAERCRWLEIGNLVDDALADRLQSLDCAGRERLARRTLRIGAPMYSVSTSDLFTEHLARVTRVKIGEHSAGQDGESWADDVRELMVRYGWPRWYSRADPPMGSQASPSIIGHDAGMPYNYFPSLAVIDRIGAAGPDDWHLDDARASTGYSASYARTMHDLPSQVARFRRGDSTLIVAAWDARRDTTLIGRSLDAALVIWSDDSSRAVMRRSDARATGTLTATAVADSGLVSLELLAKQDRRAARTRIGFSRRDSSRVALSDLLLYTPTATSADALETVQDDAFTSDVIPPSRALGVYWETYGLQAAGEPVRFTLTVEQIGVSWLRRAAERLRFADRTTGLRIQWQEVPQRTNGIAGRGVRVDVSRLRAGRYRMQLTVNATGEPSAVATREIDVR